MKKLLFVFVFICAALLLPIFGGVLAGNYSRGNDTVKIEIKANPIAGDYFINVDGGHAVTANPSPTGGVHDSPIFCSPSGVECQAIDGQLWVKLRGNWYRMKKSN